VHEYVVPLIETLAAQTDAATAPAITVPIAARRILCETVMECTSLR